MQVGNPTNGNWGGVIFSGSQVLGGNGTVIFGNNSASSSGAYVNALVLGNPGTTLAIGPEITVRGQYGSIGYSPGWGVGEHRADHGRGRRAGLGRGLDQQRGYWSQRRASNPGWNLHGGHGG